MIYKLAPHVHVQGHDPNIKNPSIKDIVHFFSDYDIILMVMHSTNTDKKHYSYFVKECKKNSTKNKLLIPCLENSGESCHVLLVGAVDYTKDIFNPYRSYLTILAHPYARGYNKNKINNLNLEQFDGIEVWNLLGNSREYPSLKTLNLFKNASKKVKSHVGLDEHPPFEKSDAAMFVECENLNTKDVLDSLKNGRFYNKINGFTITSEGAISYHGKNLGAVLRIKSFIRESTNHLTFFIFTLGSNMFKKVGVQGRVRYIVNRTLKKI